MELVTVGGRQGKSGNSDHAKFHNDGTLLIRNSYYAPSDYCIQRQESIFRLLYRNMDRSFRSDLLKYPL